MSTGVPKPKKITYNKTNEFKKRCEEALKTIEDACYDMHIPFFFCAATENNGSKTHYERRIGSVQMENIILSDDEITKHLKLAAHLPMGAQKHEMVMNNNPFQDEIDQMEDNLPDYM